MNIREALSDQINQNDMVVTESNISNLTTKFFMPDGTAVVPVVGDSVYVVGITEHPSVVPPEFAVIKITMILDRMIGAMESAYIVDLPLNTMMPRLVPRAKA